MHGFLRKCQTPACPGNPVATKDRSGRTQCQAEKTGIVERVTRWQDTKTGQKGDHPHLKENHSAWLKNVKASAAIAWQMSPPCQQLMWSSHVLDAIGALFLEEFLAKLEDLGVVLVGCQILRFFAELVDLLRLAQVLKEGFLVLMALELFDHVLTLFWRFVSCCSTIETDMPRIL